jgi:hypothetical protein
MNSRGLLIAAITLAALSGLVYWSKKHKEAEASKPASDAAPKILALDEKQIDEVRIQKSGADPLVVSRIADRWDITKPQPYPADQETVKSLVSTAATLASDQLVDEKAANLAPFGLDQPASKIALHQKNGKTTTLDLGAQTPAGGSVYAKLEGDPRVFTVASFSSSSLDKSLNDLRDKRLLTFNQDKISRIEVTAKGASMEFGKNAQNDWQVLKPEPLRADALQVDDLVRKLHDAHMDLSGPAVDAAKFNATDRVGTASVTDSSGVQTIEVRQDKDKNTYAKSSVVPGFYKIAADVAESLSKPLADYRNKKLFDFGFGDLSQLTAQGVVYTKSGEKWFANGKEMDGNSMAVLIDKLRDLTATGFGQKAEGSQIFEASVVTKDKKRTEKVVITRQGSNTFARREGEPSIYILENGAADDLIKATSDVKPAPAKPKK